MTKQKAKQQVQVTTKLSSRPDNRGKLFRCVQPTEIYLYDLKGLEPDRRRYAGVVIEPGGVVLALGREICFTDAFNGTALRKIYEREILYGETVGWVLSKNLRSAKSWRESKIIEDPDFSDDYRKSNTWTSNTTYNR